MLGHGASIVRDGLVLHLDAANPKSYSGSGTVWNDLSGNGNHVTMDSVYVPVYNSSGYFYFNGGANFETQSANIVLSSEVTLSGWYKRTGSGGGSPRILETHQTGALVSASNCLAVDTDGSLRAWVDVNGTTSSRIGDADDSTQYGLNIWKMFTMTYNGSQVKIYVNGVNTASYSGSNSNIDDANIITIGAISDINTYTHNAHYFTGNISISKIYNRALSTTEIQQNFEATRDRYGI